MNAEADYTQWVNDARQVILLAADALRCLRMESERAEFDVRDARGFLMAIIDRHRAMLARIRRPEGPETCERAAAERVAVS